MKAGLKPILWSAAAFLALVLLAVPLLNFPASLLLTVSYVVLYATLSRGAFILHLLPVWILAAVVAGPSLLIIGLFFLVPSIVMGHLYQKGVSAAKVIRTVGIVFLAQLMLELLLFEMVFDLSLLSEFSEIVRTTMNGMMTPELAAAGWNEEMTEQLIQTVMNIIPLIFILFSFIYAVLAHFFARRAVQRSGIEVPAFPKAKDWRLPRVLVIYYLIAYVADLFLRNGDDSFLNVAVMNLVPLLSFLFTIQAIGFFFFIAHERGWSKAVPILIAIPVLLIPPLSLIGVLDTAFPIRKSFVKPQ
ncbi:DUF2232 domain-containing protein [Paenibacillus nanensis]|uniref:DUF2232 domain-containing protein n=1 Tax=Paenibacillus nanensis TaxID=393251 RepID=UPI00269DA922